MTGPLYLLPGKCKFFSLPLFGRAGQRVPRRQWDRKLQDAVIRNCLMIF